MKKTTFYERGDKLWPEEKIVTCQHTIRKKKHLNWVRVVSKFCERQTREETVTDLTFVMTHATGYSLRASDSLTVPHFSSIFGKNSIAHRGPVLWNILISKDKHFSNTSYKNLKRKIRLMDIFKELTFKETSTTTTNFRHKDFNYI